MASMTEKPRDLAAAGEDDSIDLLELFVHLMRFWKTGLLVFLVAFATSAAVIFHIKPQFEANVTILTGQGGGESNSLSAMFSGKRPGDTYVGLLRSRTVADDVIQRLGLKKLYGTTSLDVARGELARSTKIFTGPDLLLLIIVRNENAEMAARIADAYLDAMQDQHESMALTQAAHSRVIYGRQVQQEKDALAAAEEDLRKTQESLGVVQEQTQTQLGLSAIAGISGQITSLRVQLASLLLGSTEQNPQVQALRSQIAQLEARERSLETGRSKTPEGGAVSLERMPSVNLELARKQREVRYHELLFNTLLNQLQNANISQVASLMSFEVVDRASVPEFRAWPPRPMLLEVALASCVLLALVTMVLQMFGQHVLADPQNREHLHELGRQFHLGR